MANALQAAMGASRSASSSKKKSSGQSPAKALASARARMKKMREHSEAGIGQVVHLAEGQGACFLASMAEGYLGSDKLEVAGVDLRLGVGGAGALYGLYQTFQGQDASHILALSTGVVASGIASAGLRAGQAVAKKGGKSPVVKLGAATNAPRLSGHREIHVSPATDGDERAPVRLGRRRQRRR